MSARENTRSLRAHVEDDLEIMPLMNLFVALIPMLLISAVFLNVTVIDMKAPAPGEIAAADAGEALGLTVTIDEDRFLLRGHGLRDKSIDRAAADPWRELGLALQVIVAAHPENEDVIIASRDHTRYDDIIAVMDAAREAGLPRASLLGAD